MIRNILQWLWYIGAVAALCLIAVILHHKYIISPETLFIICMYMVVEALILAVVLGVLQKLDMLVSIKLIAYYTVVVGGSLAIVFLLTPVENTNLLPYALSVFMLFVFLNLGLLEIMFDTSFWKACLMSIITGLINALMVVITTPFYR